jgi:solute carrier family 50 protein (sugar transporter)
VFVFFFLLGMVVAQMKVLKLLAIVVVGFVFVVVLILELVHDKTRRKLIIGTLCAVFAVGMYASPLTIMVSNLIR